MLQSQASGIIMLTTYLSLCSCFLIPTIGKVLLSPSVPNQNGHPPLLEKTEISIGRTQQVHIPPLVTCLSKKLSFHEVSSGCIVDCPENSEPYKSQKMRIYNPLQAVSHVEVFMCITETIEQTFTETWTFSRFSTKPIVSREDPDEQECKRIWEQVCKKESCYVHKNVGPKPEFAYASDITEYLKYSYGNTRKQTQYGTLNFADFFLELGENSKKVSFKEGKHIDHESKIMYLWDGSRVSSMCPLKSYRVAICLVGNLDVICPTLGLFLSNIATKMISGCGPSQSDREFKYSAPYYMENALEADHVDERPFLSLSSSNEEIKQVSAAINNALNTRDTSACLKSCLLVNSVPWKEGSILAAGYKLYKTQIPNLVECVPLTNCKIIRSAGACYDPVMFSVRCDQGDYYWELDTLEAHHVKPCRLKELSGEYKILTSLGFIIKNSSGFFLQRDHAGTDSFSHPIPLTNRENTITLDDVEHEMSSPGKKVVDDQGVVRNVINISGSSWDWNIWEPVKSFLRSVDHTVKIGAIISFTGLAVIVGAKLWGQAKESRPRIRSRVDSYQMRPLASYDI